PVVALLLLLCGELAAWSLDERPRILTSDLLEWRRGAALGGMALAGIVASAFTRRTRTSCTLGRCGAGSGSSFSAFSQRRWPLPRPTRTEPGRTPQRPRRA